MRVALLLLLTAILFAVLGAVFPLPVFREVFIWFSGMNVALAFRSAEIERFGKGGGN